MCPSSWSHLLTSPSLLVDLEPSFILPRMSSLFLFLDLQGMVKCWIISPLLRASLSVHTIIPALHMRILKPLGKISFNLLQHQFSSILSASHLLATCQLTKTLLVPTQWRHFITRCNSSSPSFAYYLDLTSLSWQDPTFSSKWILWSASCYLRLSRWTGRKSIFGPLQDCPPSV